MILVIVETCLSYERETEGGYSLMSLGGSSGELCKAPYPAFVDGGRGKVIELFEIPRPSFPYIILGEQNFLVRAVRSCFRSRELLVTHQIRRYVHTSVSHMRNYTLDFHVSRRRYHPEGNACNHVWATAEIASDSSTNLCVRRWRVRILYSRLLPEGGRGVRVSAARLSLSFSAAFSSF